MKGTGEEQTSSAAQKLKPLPVTTGRLVQKPFGSRYQPAAASAPPPAASGEWVLGGITYAGYNIVGAVIVLALYRSMAGRRPAARLP